MHWGAAIADFDDDGADDIFLGRHGAPARLFLSRRALRGRRCGFGSVDRHGCAAEDVDGAASRTSTARSGADAGRASRRISSGSTRPGRVASATRWSGRAAEPLGRGRVAAFLDVDLDGHDDLFVGQETERMDGLPSDNRVYLRAGPARFDALAGSGIDPEPLRAGRLHR